MCWGVLNIFHLSFHCSTYQEIVETESWNNIPFIKQVVYQVPGVRFQGFLFKYNITHMGVSKNSGTPKWMVYNGKLFKMDDLGVPLFSETSIYLYMWEFSFLSSCQAGVVACSIGWCSRLWLACFSDLSPLGRGDWARMSGLAFGGWMGSHGFFRRYLHTDISMILS